MTESIGKAMPGKATPKAKGTSRASGSSSSASLCLALIPTASGVTGRIGLALLALLGLSIFIAAMLVMLPGKESGPSPDVVIGWPNRIMILAQRAWLIPVAWLTIRAGPLSSADPPAQNASVPPMRGPLGSET